MSAFSYMLLSFAAIIYVFVYKWRRRKLLKVLKKFDELPTLPVVGNLHLIAGNLEERLKKIFGILKTLTFPVVLWFFHIPFIAIGTWEDMQIVMNKTTERDVLGLFKNVLKEGILFANGEKWRRARRMMNPAFAVFMLREYTNVFNKESKVLVKKLNTFAKTNETVDLWSYLMNTNMKISMQSLTGHEPSYNAEEMSKFIGTFLKCLELESIRLTKPWLMPNLINNVYLFFTGNWNIFSKVHLFVAKMVHVKIMEHENEKNIKKENSEEKPVKSLLDMLIKLRDVNPNVSEDDMKIEILNMFVAGSETTSLTTSFLLLMFAIHPAEQERAYEEVVSIFKDNDKPTEMEDLNQLVYLEQCIKETLRKFTIIPVTFRKNFEEIILSKKQTIPSNSTIVVAFHAVHTDPTLYPNPDEWNPEHFSPEATKNHSKYAFLGFGAGPRTCIGSKYAMLSIKTQMVYLLRKYRFTTHLTMDDIILTLDICFRSKNGYPVQIRQR